MGNLTEEEKQAIGQKFTDLARTIKGRLDSMAYTAPELMPTRRAEIWQAIGNCCDDVIEMLDDEEAR